MRRAAKIDGNHKAIVATPLGNARQRCASCDGDGYGIRNIGDVMVAMGNCLRCQGSGYEEIKDAPRRQG